MQITIVSVEDKGKTCKYKTADGKTYNGVVSKIGKLLANQVYEIEYKEEDYTPPNGKPVKMKWIEKAGHAGYTATPNVAIPVPSGKTIVMKPQESAMSKDDWDKKEIRARKTMIMSYAKDFAIGYMEVEKNKLVDEDHFLKVVFKAYDMMLKEVEK